MKSTLLLAFLCTATLSFAATTLAGERVSSCRVTVNDLRNGAMLASNESVVRFGKADLIEVGVKDFPSLHLKITEEQMSPDSFGFAASASELPKNSYFNATGAGALGGTFGNGRIFGSVTCENPREVPFYYASASGKIMLQDDNRSSLKGMLTQGGCVGGDLAAAAKDLTRYWYYGIEGTPTVVGNSYLEWTEVSRKCLKEEDNGGDLPGPSCAIWDKPVRTVLRTPVCESPAE